MILEGFSRFCNQYAFSYIIINNLKSHEIQKGEAYICLMEDDLVELAEKIIALKWKAGKEVGIISYNETPVKRIILDGITTISTDFSMLGSEAAKCILNNSKDRAKVPLYLNLRSSL